MADEILLSKSNYWKRACLNAALRGVPFTAPSKVYIALYTSNPTDADTGQEVTGGGYARSEVSFSEPTFADRWGSARSSADVYMPIATKDWGLITYIGIRDAMTGGNLLYHGAITKPRTILEDDHIRFAAGKLVIDEG
ncbi:hypothetical protein [Paenibacillus sp. Mc5Re-14]|uniref:phage tail fiber protein n=1 Tax=Paenibacillus sp. Mc5Re-14 TaxID=1030529 RepID=UPI000AC9213D|nr:hypothetical protein [Paenibacillus sp. Mc5Re-14]